ncbi:(deoxy)nucleoside triphosphate pyrophosphohydrolase [uncultured Legionella sp.]|uniref:(deoxy)nucleoside triphosphate pyrophosphohydrolase n=1 Tax=uncultured Legionella sp. TaxID=210934 RepID=UPI0026185B20|nr:(deoxy)nucleoside triphosphate pyrophosphohydrolase [uncultured Legionella sp.]
MKVAVAIITDDKQHVLVTQRPLHVPHGGCWEFPGGKVESNESPEMALIREIKEEVNLDVQQFQYLGDVVHQYKDKKVELIVFHVSQFAGVPSCKEEQLSMKWIKLDDLNPDDFPEANKAIISLIQAPEFIS